ncbi:MAG TPA: hypothetical protein VGI45_28750 [Terracidiphilus sp.]
MRRVLSILLALAFGLGPVAFAIGYDESTSLPACCRRQGAHHCAMSPKARAYIARALGKTPAFTSPTQCPLYPVHGNASPISHAALIRNPILSLGLLEQVRARASRISRPANSDLRIPALRGPPSSRRV